MSFLTVAGLRKIFPGGTVAVDDLSLEFERGELAVLLGPSGCGKTTSLRLIAGLETPDRGEIAIDGAEVTSVGAAERDIGFVFQFFALYPRMTVRQNIEFPLECARLAPALRQETVARVVERMEIGHLLDRYPAQLSGGDQQRVGLARAMVRSPRLFLMDEPLGTLDADQRYEMQEFIRAHQQQLQVTTIYVTHDQEEAMSLADRIVVMDQGRVQQVGAPGLVYDHPANLFVANFLGHPGMNFLPGAVQRQNGSATFVPDGSETAIPLAQDVAAGQATLGVRAEFVRVGEQGCLRGEVAVNEFLGAARLLYLDTPVGRLTARVAAHDTARPGNVLALDFDPDHIRLFDEHGVLTRPE